MPEHVEREFRRYLDCGILAHGFARARCGRCGHDLPVAFSCQGRGVCPSRNARRMVETAAHLTDHVLPDLPVRQWVLAVPKRLRYFLQRDADLQGAALRLFLRALAISQGDLSIFVTQPISATVFAITALILAGPPIWRRIARRRASP